MAVNTTKSVKQKEVKAEPANGIKWPEEWGKLVKVYIPTEDGDETPMLGCLNGVNWKIPRNEWVEVPEAIDEIINQTRNVIRESEKRNKEFEEGRLNLT